MKCCKCCRRNRIIIEKVGFLIVDVCIRSCVTNDIKLHEIMVLIYFISSNLRFTPSIDGRGGLKLEVDRTLTKINKVAN